VGRIIANETVRATQRGRSVTVFDATRIAYRYSVAGPAYESDRVSPAARPVRAASAEGRRRAAAYPLGATVTVYYDPADPARSLLERPPQTAALRNGGLLALLGLAVLLGSKRFSNAPPAILSAWIAAAPPRRGFAGERHLDGHRRRAAHRPARG